MKFRQVTLYGARIRCAWDPERLREQHEIAILTGVTAQLGTQAQLGYAMDARLEYISPAYALFGFGQALYFSSQGLKCNPWVIGNHSECLVTH